MNFLSKLFKMFRGVPESQKPQIPILENRDLVQSSNASFGVPLYRTPTRCEQFGRHKAEIPAFINMFNPLKIFVCEYRRRNAQRTCQHEFQGPATVSGPWSEPQPHPHPHFAQRLKVRIQRYAEIRVCFKCEKVSATFKYNQKDAEPELFEDPRKNDSAFSPKRVFDDKGNYLRDA